MTPSNPVEYCRSRPQRFLYLTLTSWFSPKSTASFARCGSARQGASIEKPRSLASAESTRAKYSDEICDQGATAPSDSDRSSSGITSSGSTSSRLPIPVHSEHAP